MLTGRNSDLARSESRHQLFELREAFPITLRGHFEIHQRGIFLLCDRIFVPPHAFTSVDDLTNTLFAKTSSGFVELKCFKTIPWHDSFILINFNLHIISFYLKYDEIVFFLNEKKKQNCICISIQISNIFRFNVCTVGIALNFSNGTSR